MSYDQTFKGSFSYVDERCIEAALDGFVTELSDSVVLFEDLKLDGLEISVAVDVSAPATMYEATLVALRALGIHAASGSVKTTFHLDRVSRTTVGNGRRRSSADLPAPHRRWEVFRAARSGAAAWLRELRDAGVSLACTYPAYRGWSALHIAADAGAVEAVEVMLDASVDPDLVCGNGVTPLTVAATAEVAQRLLARSANPQVKAESVIAEACARHRADVVVVLLEAGARMPAFAYTGLTMACVRRDELATLRALVTRDASFEPALSDPEVIAAAIQTGDSVLVDYLLEHGAKLPDSYLTDVVKAGAVSLLEAALRSPDTIAGCGTSAHGSDAMCVAAIAGKLESMQVLARHGVPIHPQHVGPTSPIHCAARSHSPDAQSCLRWLLAQGVSIHSKNADGETVIAYAGERRGAETAAFLVQLGANADEITLGMLGRSGHAAFLRLVAKQA